ncbi:hypothetical protein BC830DRAFT_1170259 [Chytriomyces sp. MP71]|nr:hypothetical protein BC830DRAFT_1170259 [Chytriomyces sp. MP71]
MANEEEDDDDIWDGDCVVKTTILESYLEELIRASHETVNLPPWGVTIYLLLNAGIVIPVKMMDIHLVTAAYLPLSAEQRRCAELDLFTPLSVAKLILRSKLMNASLLFVLFLSIALLCAESDPTITIASLPVIFAFECLTKSPLEHEIHTAIHAQTVPLAAIRRPRCYTWTASTPCAWVQGCPMCSLGDAHIKRLVLLIPRPAIPFDALVSSVQTAPIHFPTLLPPLASGEPNLTGYRRWNDILRTRQLHFKFVDGAFLLIECRAFSNLHELPAVFVKGISPKTVPVPFLELLEHVFSHERIQFDVPAQGEICSGAPTTLGSVDGCGQG